MSGHTASGSVSLDETDRAVLRALQLAPRGAFSRVGEILGISEQTVARRYRRLRRDGLVRVVAAVSPEALGLSSWIARVHCRPDGTVAIADALARRDDVSWVVVAAAGSEVVCSVRSRSPEQRDELLLQRLPRTAPVLGISASVLLHWFVGGRSDDWAGLGEVVSPEQTARLRELSADPGDADRVSRGPTLPGADRTRGVRPGAVALEAGDEPLLAALQRSGRASYAELAAAAGISEGRAGRRLAALLESGILYLDVDLSAQQLGFATQANLWLTVTPAHLHEAGRALATYPEVAFAAAISGPWNLAASVVCRDLDHLYRFATVSVGSLAGVQGLEISPVLRHVKQSGAVSAGGRLMDALPPRRPRPRRQDSR